MRLLCLATIVSAAAAFAQGDVFSSGSPRQARRGSDTTGTQSIHPCEAPTNRPGGTRGRTTDRTGSQNPWTNPRKMDCKPLPPSQPREEPSEPLGSPDSPDFSGVLRCRAGEAFVGMRLARAAAIDYLQIACAPVQCNGGTCSWTRAMGEEQVGNPKGGGGGLVSVDVTIDQTCPNDSVVTGFKGSATLAGKFAYDLQFQCQPVAGRPPDAFVNGVTVTPVRATPVTDAARRDPASGLSMPLRNPALSSSCDGSGATGLAYTIGRYGLGIQVVKSVSLECVKGSSSCPLGDPSLPPLAEQLKADGSGLKEMSEVAADHFVLGVGDTLVGTLEWLATPCENGGALGQTAQQFLQFFTLTDAQRNQALSQAAEDGWNQFTSDPARFFGQQAPNAIPVEKGVQLARQAAVNLRLLDGFAKDFGTIAGIFKGTKFNPGMGTCNCFPVSIAYDRTRATWRLYQAGNTPLVSGQTITDVLRRSYGRRALDPNHGPLGVLAHRIGIPMRSSVSTIERALTGMAASDARGLIFVREPGQVGHVFNVFKSNGQVYFFDAQVGLMYYSPSSSAPLAKKLVVPAGADVFFYRTN